jgi:predicted transposase YdaD
MEGRKGGRKDGRKEGRKEERKEGRNEGRKEAKTGSTIFSISVSCEVAQVPSAGRNTRKQRTTTTNSHHG